jgi:hypothetical protein
MGKFAMKYLYLLSIFALLPLASPSLLAQDTSCGIAWGPILNLSGEDPNAFWPHVAVQGETLHVTWFGGGYRLPYRRSLDGGATWEPIREMIGDTTVFFATRPWVVANTRFVYLVSSNNTPQGSTPVLIMKSSDRGTTWSVPDSINSERAGTTTNVSIHGDTIVVQYERPSPHSMFTFFRTTNGGQTWDSTRAPARAPVVIGGGAFHNARQQPIDGDEVVYKRSLNLGDSWQDSVVLSSLDGEWSHDVRVTISEDIPPRIYVTWRDTKYGCLTLVGCSIIMRMSGDGGLSWSDEYLMTDAPVGYNWDWGQQIATGGEKAMAVWTNDQTGHIDMRYSVNQGDSWSPLCDVTPGRSTTDPSCTITPSLVHVLWEDLYADGAHIYYRRGLLLSDQVEEPKATPKAFSLMQNYPNPFNGETRIEYALDRTDPESWVTLRVYNVLGQEVATLVNERQESGRHCVTWDGSRASSGVYIYRLSVSKDSSPTRILRRTMMLLK